MKGSMSFTKPQTYTRGFPRMWAQRVLKSTCGFFAAGKGGYVFALLPLFWLLVGGCQPPGERPLTVGMELDYPPFEMTDAQGRPTGVSVDLAQALAAHLQRPVKVRNVSFDGLVPALKTGKIDLIISSMTATPERAQSIDFSDPYVKTGICLLVNKDSPLQTTADIEKPGLTVAVKKGTTGQIYAHEHLPHAKLLVLDKESTCVLEVVQGKADAFIYGQLSIHRDWQRNRDTTRALLTPLRAEYWAIGIRKGNDDLRRQVNEFLHTFRAAGGFDKLSDRYLKAEKMAFAQMGIPFLFLSETE